MNQKVDLVTDNYYEKTLIYQNQIDEAERSKQFDKVAKLEYLNNQLRFSIPDSLAENIKAGELFFYRPSNSLLDFKIPFQLNEGSEILLDVSKIEKGYWKVQMKWLMNEESYWIERTVMIN
jgi:nitrogen fixation protein FixH